MNPDIVIGVETWLTSSNQDKDYFPVDEYEVRRRGRDTKSNDDGGVFILTKRDMIVQRKNLKQTVTYSGAVYKLREVKSF